MALSEQVRALLRGLRPVPGSWRLVGLRWALLLLSGLPGMLLLRAMLSSGAGRISWLVEGSGRLDLARLLALLTEIGPLAGAAIVLSVILGLLGQQVLTPGAVAWLDRMRLGQRPRGVFSNVVAEGTPWLWTMFRIVLLAILLDLLGLGAIILIAEKIGVHGLLAGWSSVTLDVVLPRLRLLLTAAWIALVGAGAFWCRLVMVADGRRRIRSAFFIVLRAWRRAALAGPVTFIAVTWMLQVLLGAVIVLWRQHPAADSTQANLRVCGWALLLLLSAVVWHWLLRAALLTYTASDLFSIRTRPDRPWYLLRRLFRIPLPREEQHGPEGPVVIDSNLPGRQCEPQP